MDTLTVYAVLAAEIDARDQQPVSLNQSVFKILLLRFTGKFSIS